MGSAKRGGGAGSRRRDVRAAVALILGASFLTVFFAAVLSPLAVDGPSMAPTFVEGDVVWLYRLAYGLRAGRTMLAAWADPERGDLVVIRSPADGSLAVKRVAAVGGDPLVVSGPEIVLPGLRAALTSAQSFHLMGLESVPRGQVFLLGDSPDDSEDSREYGCVPVAAVLGKVIGSIRRR